MQQLLPSLPPSTQPVQYALSHILHHSVTYARHPFSQQQCHLSILVLSPKFIHQLSGSPQFCTHHPTSPAISLKFPTSHLEMSHIFPYSSITQYTPLVTNHSMSLLILQQPALSLNSNLTLSCPCTNLTFSTPVSFFANLYYFNALFV